MFRGFGARLEQELSKLGEEVKVVASSGKKYGVWNGGVVLASMSLMEGLWVTKAEFEENGESIVQRK
eukprot:CAMPEP_0205834160 /NCGR_PEP_ID=MMETSP0206-20130828/50564_1 /ASSEMBLY_ACC=CAM_ASM_000279 /TAXON_ID=36767 /ORGANISM="Euplotes focardii, Strain TN1" /LENGTH=66 /DNA_ID=CAMNT_0053141053 /DNA_START=709 /DNA_END=909 /DNA_ORIENTATION=+